VIARTRVRLTCTLLLIGAFQEGLFAQQAPAPEDRVLPDFDVRDRRAPAAPSSDVRAALERLRAARGELTVRFDRVTGAARTIDLPARRGLSQPQQAQSPRATARDFLQTAADALGLSQDDVRTLVASREFWTKDTGTRHVFWKQVIDNVPVFDAVVGAHLAPDGSVLRLTSSAVTGRGRSAAVIVGAARAAEIAAADIGAGRTIEGVDAALAWFPLDNRLRLAWHVIISPGGFPQEYDVLVDAESGELLLRRNRVKYAEGSGRILQSPATAAQDPRRPDPRPFGVDGTGASCPPVSNHAVQSLTAAFRDPFAVLGGSGRLEGNNTHVFRRAADTEGAAGVFQGGAWQFDFPFNTADAAETSLFFAVNYAHDFFYDLGFDEDAGNFQLDNFGRGGTAGDPVLALARANGRNNATWLHADEGQSPTMSMFLWDGVGCWGEDVDADGSPDLDGDFDLDIIVHEYHHGVSLRLNTAWTGNEAGAMGEGGGDFFAYSINGDTVLAEYSRLGGIRSINGKTYADWSCLFFLFCSVHDNGEIWANVLWDSSERFRADAVGGSGEAGARELQQLYVDGLKLSPPSPTMLDMRDAMLLADAIRNPDGDRSVNFCRLWESFAGRGMGLAATDTSQNSFNRVVADYSVPEGCSAPPSPSTVSITAVSSTANEAGPVPASLRVARDGDTTADLTVTISVGGTASPADYLPLAGTVTIPAGAADATVLVTPVDDTLFEGNETVTVYLQPAGGYVVGTPSSATVTIVSDDVAPDLQITTISAPAAGAAGGSIAITETTANTGAGAAPETTTAFYLSSNLSLDSSDPLLGERTVPPLAPGGASPQVTTVQLPEPLAPGTYQVFAKVDPANAVLESAEYNNLRSRSISVGPDLTVTAFSGPPSGAAGGIISVTDTVANAGAADAAASTTRFYLSTNGVFDTGDVPLGGSRAVPALAAGATSAGMTSLTLPSGTATGTYYVFARADGNEQLAEASETNNTRWFAIQIGGDLVMTALSGPLRAAPGATVAVYDTTKNQGGGSVGASTTAFYLSANYSLDAGDVRLQPGRSIPALSAGYSSSGTTMVTIPADVTPGLWQLFAVADADAAVAETLESNNTRAVSVLIGPDLQVSSIGALAPTPAGGIVNVTDTVANRGAGTAGVSRVRYYLSVNVILDAADELLAGAHDVPALAAGSSSSGTAAVTIPAGKAPGNYFIIAVADGDLQVPESSETNNSGFRGIQITN
jgi:subtilase family serine protease